MHRSCMTRLYVMNCFRRIFSSSFSKPAWCLLVALSFVAPTALLAEKPGVAVAPFESGDNRNGETLAAQVLARLQRAGGIQLTERGQLSKVLAELSLGESGAVDESSAPEIGRLVGAQYLILGRVDAAAAESDARSRPRDGNTFTASVRVVRAETGVVIGAGYATGTMQTLADRLAADALNTLRIYLALENPESPYSVLLKLKGGSSAQVDGKNPTYRVGDQLSLEFKVLRHNNDAPRFVYVQLYSIDAQGALTLIYPNKFSPQARVEVDREYRLPADADDFEWILTEPVGSEKIQAIVTTEPIDFFQLGDRYKTEAFPAVDGKRYRDDVRTYRGIVTRIKKEKLKDWVAERVTYQLVKP